MSNDRYERIRSALAMGPTPGEWYWSDAYPAQDGRKTWSLIGDGGFGILSCDGEENSPQSVNAAAAELIAACDPDTIQALIEERDQLAAALEAAREDAERYRWLRENCVDWAEDTDEPQLVHRDGGLWRTDWRERLDTAIDRARRPYNASGSLSEYGILPECDAAIDQARGKGVAGGA